MRRVVLLRSNPVNPDPAVERIASVLADIGWKVTIVGWDRNGEYDFKKGLYSVGTKVSGCVDYILINLYQHIV